MANYNFDLKTEKEQRKEKALAILNEKNKFMSRYAIEGPKVDGGHNDVLDGFKRGRPVKKSVPIKMPDIPRDYTGVHVFEHDCAAASIISASQQISSMKRLVVGKLKFNETLCFRIG